MAQIAILAVMAVSALNEGAQKRKVKYAEGQALGEAGRREMAATSAEVAEAKRTKERVQSRAIAVAANSGAGVGDPTVVNLIGDLAAEGEYNMLAKLYTGSSEASGLHYQAEVARKEGEAALQQGYMNAAKTVMSEYGNYGEMWDEATETFNKFKYGRQQKKIKNVIDPNMSDSSSMMKA